MEASHQWFIEKIAEHDLGRRKVSELMTDTVATVGPDTSLTDAAREMLRDRVHRLPVVDEKQRLLGIVSTMDLLGAFADGAPE